MADLDFKRATDLFLGSDRELGLALGIPVEQLGEYRARPDNAPAPLIEKLGKVLVERGRGMMRVGEMLLERSAQ